MTRPASQPDSQTASLISSLNWPSMIVCVCWLYYYASPPATSVKHIGYNNDIVADRFQLHRLCKIDTCFFIHIDVKLQSILKDEMGKIVLSPIVSPISPSSDELLFYIHSLGLSKKTQLCYRTTTTNSGRFLSTPNHPKLNDSLKHHLHTVNKGQLVGHSLASENSQGKGDTVHTRHTTYCITHLCVRI